MTSIDRFEQRLPEHLADLAAARIPDYFDDLLQEAARTRQRPAWSSLERWLPMGVTALAPVSNRTRSTVGFALLILVGLLVAAGVAAYAGSHLQRVPTPFGPAGNGLMFYASSDGDIFSVDPVKGGSKALVHGSEPYTYPYPSRDGRRFLIDHTADDVSRLFVADADGSNVHPLAGTYAGYSWTDWSPDGADLSIVSKIDGVPSVSIVPADGSPARALALGMGVEYASYLPDGRLIFLGTTTSGARTYGVYIVNDDGSGLKPILPATSSDGDWLGVNPSPDGRSIVYHRWRSGVEPGRLHVVDIASGIDRPVAMDGTSSEENHENAQFSPDSSHILFVRFEADRTRLAIVPVAGGTPVAIGPTVAPDAGDNTAPTAIYSPDGSTVLAYYPVTKELWLLDATGGQAGGDRLLSLPVSDTPGWQRVAP